jgi:hypothetical protein
VTGVGDVTIVRDEVGVVDAEEVAFGSRMTEASGTQSLINEEFVIHCIWLSSFNLSTFLKILHLVLGLFEPLLKLNAAHFMLALQLSAQTPSELSVDFPSNLFCTR